LGGVYTALEGNMFGILQCKQYTNCYDSHRNCVIWKINTSNYSKQIAVKNAYLSIYISLANFTSSSELQYPTNSSMKRNRQLKLYYVQ